CNFGNDPLLGLLNAYVLQGALDLGGTRPFLWDTRTGRARHVLPMAVGPDFSSSTGHCWSSDGTVLAVAGIDRLAVLGIPPRKSRKWFAAGAALFALPPFMIARRRVRRLRREAAA